MNKIQEIYASYGDMINEVIHSIRDYFTDICRLKPRVEFSFVNE